MGYIPPKNMYDAKIGDRNIRVDIYDLPYDEFSAEEPLIILGNVLLADQSRTTDLSNVHIIGNLDISKQKYSVILPARVEGAFICRSNPQMRDITTRKKVEVFNDNFVFPDGITEIDCSHSISNLSVLRNKIPSTVKKVIVANAVLSKLSEDADLWNIATILQQQYPDVVFVGEKKGTTLSQTLAGQPKPVAKKEKDVAIIKKTEDTKTTEPEYAIKTEDFYDENEIFDLCLQDSFIKSSKILHSTLKRKIKCFINKLDSITMKDSKTNTLVVCIKKVDISKIIESLKENLQKKVQIKSEKGSKTMDNKVQTPEYSNKYEILEKCLANAAIMKLSNGDEELLKVKIRKYMNACSDRRLLLDTNSNRNISCIPAERVDALIEKVLEELKEITRKKKPVRRATKSEKTTTETTQPQKPVTVAKTVAPQKPILKPILIRKYIPQQIWKEICKACGKGNTDKQMFVLKTIASVNVNVVETPQIDGLPIINPETHIQTMSSYMKHEDGQSLVQSIDSPLRTDNKRIVWSYLPEEKILVCTGCCPEHNANKRENKKYSRIRDLATIGQNANGEKLTLQKIKNEGYISVGILFEQLLSKTQPETCVEQKQKEEKTTATHTGKRLRIPATKTEKVNYKPHSKYVAKPGLLETAEQPVESAQKLVEEKDIVPTLVEQPKEEPIAIALSTEEVKEAEQYIDKIFGVQKPKNQVDLLAMHTYIEKIIPAITDIINDGLESASKETDAAKKLEQINLIREALIQKNKIEKMMPEFSKTLLLLDTIQENTKRIQGR